MFYYERGLQSWLSVTVSVCITKSIFHQMHQQDKIAGMGMHVEHSTVVKSMLVRGIMCAVQPEAQTCD